MIHEVVTVLRDKLNAYIRLKAGINEDKVRFLDGTNFDPIQFPLDFISPVIVNIQEERTLRQNDYYQPVTQNGLQTEVNPEIRIRLTVLFVSRFKQYEQGLKFLSLIIRFFQANRLIDRDVAPELSPEIDRLFVEMLTMPMSEQNDIWNALRVCYLPSVAFRVSMLTYKDGDSLAELNATGDYQMELKKVDSE